MVNDTQAIDVFAAEVMPAVRELVAAEARLARLREPPYQKREPLHQQRENSGAVLGVAADARQAAHGSARSGSGMSRSVRAAPGQPASARYSTAGRALAQELVAVHDHLRGELSRLPGDDRAGGGGQPRSRHGAVRDREAYDAAETSGPSARTAKATADSSEPTTRSRTSRCSPGCAHSTSGWPLSLTGCTRSTWRSPGVLERVDTALVALVSSPATGMPGLRSAVDLLTDTLLSHLSYEEGELVEPLGRLGPELYG